MISTNTKRFRVNIPMGTLNLKKKYLFIPIILIILLSTFTYLVPVLRSNNYSLNVIINDNIYRDKLLFIKAFVFYPGGYTEAQTIKKPGQTTKLTLNFLINDTKMQNEINILKSHGMGSYPTLFLSIYAVDKNGNVCLVSVSYSTLDYYLSKTNDLTEALELARKDPMGLLKAGTVVINKEIVPECKPLNLSLSKIAVGYLDTNTLGKYLPKSFKHTTAGTTSSSCTSWSDWEIVFPELNNMTEPPSTWMNRIKIEGVGDEVSNIIKREMWDNYRFFFSRAYYYNKDSCTNAEDAINNLVEKYTLLLPGVYTMNDFVATVSKYVSSDPTSFTAQWSMTYEYNQLLAHYDNAPLIRATFSYASLGEKPPTPTFFSTLTKLYQDTESIGLTVFGHLVLGSEHYVLTGQGYGVSLSPNSSPQGSPQSIGYIFAPLDIYYGFDAAYVFYNIESVTRDGTNYWKIVPLVVFLPYYKFLYDFNNVKAITDDYANPISSITRELNNAFTNMYTYWSYNDNNFHIPVRQKIYDNVLDQGFNYVYIDTNNITSIYRDDLTWLATFLLNKLIYTAAGAFFQETALLHTSTLASDTLGINFIKMRSGAIKVLAYIMSNTVSDSYAVIVYKYTMPLEYLDLNYYNETNRPLVFGYDVIVWKYPSAAPCSLPNETQIMTPVPCSTNKG